MHVRNFQTRTGAIGATHTVLVSDDAFVKTSVAIMGQGIDFQNDTLNRQRQAFAVNQEFYRENRAVIASFLSKKINARMSLKTGITVTPIFYDFSRQSLGDTSSLAAKGTTAQVQPYVSMRFRLGERVTLTAGVHGLFLLLNQTKSIEPRLAMKYQMTERQSLSLAYGIHGRVLPLGNYFTRIHGVEVNRDAGMVKAHHVVLAYDLLPGSTYRFHVEAYAQQFFDVPIARNPRSTWSILNTIDGFAKQALVNEGSGHNAGLDVSLEKSFDKGAFFVLGGSLLRSRYTLAKRQVEFPTAFSSGASANFTGGKEWTFANAAVLQIATKILYNGGQRLTPLLAGQSVSRYSTDPVLDESKAFSEEAAPYFRPDLRIAYRKNNKHSAWTLALDVQNVINRKNQDALSRTYDPDSNAWVYREQSGLTPILGFQIDF